MLENDAHVQELVQRLGLEEQEYAAKPAQPTKSEPWPFARVTDRGGHIQEDVGQKDQLKKKRAMPKSPEGTFAIDTDSSVVSSSHHASSGEQSELPTLSDVAMPSPEPSDPREKYRIHCPAHHKIPSIEAISIFGDMALPPTQVATSFGPIILRQQQTLDLRVPEYLIQPLLFDEERCPMAAVYTDFRDYGRRQITAGEPIDTVLGSPEVDLAVFFRERTPEDPHTPSTWACEYMRLLKDYDIFVALAHVFTYARFMRWAIAPSAETYALLPDAMRPTPLQRLVRHHPGCDLGVFPEMRDGLIRDMRDSIVAIQTLGCTVNWGHGLEAAIDVDQESRTMTISEMFAEHVCDLSNWSVSQKFAEVFPELTGLYHVVDQEIIPGSEVDVEEYLTQQGVENLSSLTLQRQNEMRTSDTNMKEV